MAMIADIGGMVLPDIVELNLTIDAHNRTAIVAAGLIESLLGKSTLLRRCALCFQNDGEP